VKGRRRRRRRRFQRPRDDDFPWPDRRPTALLFVPRDGPWSFRRL